MHKTFVDIKDDAFLINGIPTYAGRTWQGRKIEGLLMNSRMVQGTFDDVNPETVSWWDYPDGPWDADRNTQEFIAAMPFWRQAGLLSFTLNLQGGSPQGYSKAQPWHNSAFTETGELNPAYMQRLSAILDAADDLGMVVILGYFYFGQDQRFVNEVAVIRATDMATDWLLDQGYTNVIIEIGNEVDNRQYDYEILKQDHCQELMERVNARSQDKVVNSVGRLYVSTSMCGGKLLPEHLLAASDFVLLHGNGVSDPNRIREMVTLTRAMESYTGQPILFNEDDHFNFDQPDNNMIAAVDSYAGWGYFDYRMEGEGFEQGYQSVPVNWGMSSERKQGFFTLLAEITGV